MSRVIVLIVIMLVSLRRLGRKLLVLRWKGIRMRLRLRLRRGRVVQLILKGVIVVRVDV